MTMVLIASQGWGVVQNLRGDARQGATVTLANLDGTPAAVFTAEAASTAQGALVTNERGEIPGWVATGSYNLTVDGRTIRVQAVAGDNALNGTVNGVRAEVLVAPSSDGQTGIVIKAPDEAWAYEHGHPYGSAQAIFVMREDFGATNTPSNRVVWRVNGHGAMGVCGGIHLATGLNQDPNGAGHDHSDMAYSIHIDPVDDSVGIYIDAANETPASPYLQCRLNAGTVVAEIDNTGNVKTKGNVIGGGVGAATEATLGNLFGAASVGLGVTDSVFIHKLGANHMGLNCDRLEVMTAHMELDEIIEPAAPAANKGRLFLRDNGAGKTQLCIRFNTGPTLVLATEA